MTHEQNLVVALSTKELNTPKLPTRIEWDPTCTDSYDQNEMEHQLFMTNVQIR